MRLSKSLMAFAASLMIATPALAKWRDTSVPMNTVQNFNVSAYMGKWYEIARYPSSFERNCQGVTAEYSQNADGSVNVLNTCHKGAPNGPVKTANASAEGVGPGKFKVDFLSWLPGIAQGDYWVLYVDGGYDLAVVGEPSGRYAWILSRSPQIRQSQYDQALSVLRNAGYDTSGLIMVAH